MGVIPWASASLCLLFLGFIVQDVLATSHGSKLTRRNAKFLLTSTFVGNATQIWNWNQRRNPNTTENCVLLAISLPETYDPIHLCLKQQNLSKSAFHKEFRLNVARKGEKSVTTSLEDLAGSGRISVNGHVQGVGVSYVNGQIKDKEYYGTIIFSHLVGKRLLMCSVSPNTKRNLESFMDVSSIEEDELDEVLLGRTVNTRKGQRANAIVSCGDMHRDDDHDVRHPFRFSGFPNPTNVRHKIKIKHRKKRADPPPPNAGPTEEPDAPLPFDDSEVMTMAPISNTKANNSASGKPMKPGKYLAKLFNPAKNGTFYASVCYVVDMGYLERRFNGSPEDATVLLGGYVDIADWILRSTDFNKDGIPDNIGVRLLQVSVDFISEQMRAPGEKWGREPGGKFMFRKKLFKIVQDAGLQMDKKCDVRSAIGEVNTGKYALYERGGCTACKTKKLTSFTNPYVEKFSPRGEDLRMLYHNIRLIAFTYVSENSLCANCTGVGKRSKSAVGAFDPPTGFDSQGACIIEGDLLARSNIPLNSFRLSTCSINEGVKCFKKLAGRPNCLDFDPEPNGYCGNGIVEADEDCDCGTLASCIEQRCECSPRSGMNPCRLIQKEDKELCLSLVKCRGYRFLYELGKPNSSQFLNNVPDLLDSVREDEGTDAEQRNTPNDNSTSKAHAENRWFIVVSAAVSLCTYSYKY